MCEFLQLEDMKPQTSFCGSPAATTSESYSPRRSLWPDKNSSVSRVVSSHGLNEDLARGLGYRDVLSSWRVRTPRVADCLVIHGGEGFDCLAIHGGDGSRLRGFIASCHIGMVRRKEQPNLEELFSWGGLRAFKTTRWSLYKWQRCWW